MNTMRSLLALSVILLTAHIAFGGAWPRTQGTGFVQLGLSTIGYNKVYGDDAKKHAVGGDVRDNVLQVFAEIGVARNFAVSLAVPFKFITADPNAPATASFSKSGIGDIDLAGRYTLVNRNGFAFSSQLLLGLPTGDSKDPHGILLGDGEFNVLAKFLAGKSFYPVPLYVSGGIGYDFRTKGFSDDVLYDLEIGYGLFQSRLYVILLISGRESISNRPTLLPKGSIEEAANRIGLYTQNQEFTAIAPKLFFKANSHWGISLSYFTAAHGRNVAGGAVLAGGVLYDF